MYFVYTLKKKNNILCEYEINHAYKGFESLNVNFIWQQKIVPWYVNEKSSSLYDL